MEILTLQHRVVAWFESAIAHQFGLKVFMDAHSTVTAEEGDRYPLGPPDSLQGHSLPQTSVTGVTVEERPEPILFREIQARCKDLTVNQ